MSRDYLIGELSTRNQALSIFYAFNNRWPSVIATALNITEDDVAIFPYTDLTDEDHTRKDAAKAHIILYMDTFMGGRGESEGNKLVAKVCVKRVYNRFDNVAYDLLDSVLGCLLCQVENRPLETYSKTNAIDLLEFRTDASLDLTPVLTPIALANNLIPSHEMTTLSEGDSTDVYKVFEMRFDIMQYREGAASR